MILNCSCEINIPSVSNMMAISWLRNTFTTSDFIGSFSDTCDGDPAARQNCGYGGISAGQCVNKAKCCWDESVLGVPWCFVPQGIWWEKTLSIGGAGPHITTSTWYCCKLMAIQLLIWKLGFHCFRSLQQCQIAVSIQVHESQYARLQCSGMKTMARYQYKGAFADINRRYVHNEYSSLK